MATRRERHTFDFLVNGMSLFKATRADQLDMCGCFSDPLLEGEIAERINPQLIEGFMSERFAGLSGKRLPMFVCSECGDFACGAITFELSRDQDCVQWSQFAYENGYEPMRSEDHLKRLGPFVFDWSDYKAAIGVAGRANTNKCDVGG